MKNAAFCVGICCLYSLTQNTSINMKPKRPDWTKPIEWSYSNYKIATRIPNENRKNLV